MSVFDINKICRVCLEEGALVSIYSTEYAISPLDMIITDNDELPSSICEYCICRLGVAFQFKQQCENSDMRLRECLGLDVPCLLVIEEKGDDSIIANDGNNINEQILQNNNEKLNEHTSPELINNSSIELQKCQKPMEQIADNLNTITKIVNPLICNNIEDYTPTKFCNVGVSFGEVGTQVKDEEILAAMNAVCEMFNTNENSDVLLLTSSGNSCGEHRKLEATTATTTISNTVTKINTITNTAANTSITISDPLIDNPFLNQNNHEQLSLIDTHVLDNMVCSSDTRNNNTFDHLNDVNNGIFQATDDQTLELPEQLLKMPLTVKNIEQSEQISSSLRINDMEINKIDQNLITTQYENQTNNCYNKISTNLTDDLSTTTTIATKKRKKSINNKYREVKTNSDSNLKKKIKNILNKPEICMDCGKTFSKSGYLEAHMRTHTGDRPYKCTMCHLQFAQTGNLVLHMRVHTGEKPYQCELCSKLFSTSSNLKAHQRIHSEERNHKCHQCGRAFKSTAELTSHVGTHTGVKNHSCDLCGKAFYKTSYLNLHVRTVHVGEKRYRCSECGKEFSNSSNLTCHFRIHTGEKPFKCQYCDARFNQSSAMVRHIRQHKSDEITEKSTDIVAVAQINYTELNKFTDNSLI